MLTTRRALFPRIEPSIPAEVQRHLELIYGKLNNHALAFEHQTGKVTEVVNQINQSGASGAITSTGVTSFNARVGDVTFFPSLGFVNNQSGVAAYTVATTDKGQLILLNNAAPIAVALGSIVAPILTTPWFTTIFNQGTGTATLTPPTGTINGVASFPVAANGLALLYFDGTNWFADSPTSPSPSNATPLPDSGAGAPGVSNLYARGDHVHPDPGLLVTAYRAVSATYTIDPATDHQIECTSGTFTVTLPTAVGLAGHVFSVKNSNTGTITVAAIGGQTIDGSPTQPLTVRDNVTVMSNGSNWIII